MQLVLAAQPASATGSRAPGSTMSESRLLMPASRTTAGGPAAYWWRCGCGFWAATSESLRLTVGLYNAYNGPLLPIQPCLLPMARDCCDQSRIRHGCDLRCVCVTPFKLPRADESVPLPPSFLARRGDKAQAQYTVSYFLRLSKRGTFGLPLGCATAMSASSKQQPRRSLPPAQDGAS